MSLPNENAASAHDFNALRAQRNAEFDAWADKMRAEGWEISRHCAHNDPNACYCDCGRGGPCEHDFTGPAVEFDDGMGWSTTCIRCGMTAFSHSMRNSP